MHVFRSLADILGRIAHLIVPTPVEPERALTEDDVRSERYFRRQRAA